MMKHYLQYSVCGSFLLSVVFLALCPTGLFAATRPSSRAFESWQGEAYGEGVTAKECNESLNDDIAVSRELCKDDKGRFTVYNRKPCRKIDDGWYEGKAKFKCVY